MEFTAMHDAEMAEEAARALCSVAYYSLLAARARRPGNALELAACRREVVRAEKHHERIMAQLWRARVGDYAGAFDVCA